MSTDIKLFFDPSIQHLYYVYEGKAFDARSLIMLRRGYSSDWIEVVSNMSNLTPLLKSSLIQIYAYYMHTGKRYDLLASMEGTSKLIIWVSEDIPSNDPADYRMRYIRNLLVPSLDQNNRYSSFELDESNLSFTPDQVTILHDLYRHQSSLDIEFRNLRR